MSDHNRDLALRLGEATLPVFPCRLDNRRPLVRWRDESTADPERIAELWERHPGALPAIDLAKAGLVVLDGDQHGGPDGVAALRDMFQQRGFDCRQHPGVRTPRNGIHVYLRQNGSALTNSPGNLPAGIDIRGAGGYVIAPGARLPDGRSYEPIAETPSLRTAYAEGAIPYAPQWLAEIVRKPERDRSTDTFTASDARGAPFATAALNNIAAELAGVPEPGRNEALNKAAFRMGRMVARKWITGGEVESRLLSSAHANGLVKKKGKLAAERTIASGLNAGEREPHPDPEDRPREKDRKAETEQPRAGAGVAEPIFDPWDTWVVPRFPLDVLPSPVQRFVSDQSAVVGCDASALAMTCIANFSASIHHRFALKLMRHGDWWAVARIWLVLVGDVSRKKTPVFNTAFAELEAHEHRERAAHRQATREYEAAAAQWDPKVKGPPPEPPAKPPRFVTSEITPEKMADLLSGSERGILVKRDELVGWIGSMEKYGSRGGAADRAFWLQSYDGGPYQQDRIGRGEVYIPNLSATIVGGVQPQRLAEIKGLTSDGLLQRFIPVMMGPSSFASDVPSSESFEHYRQLTRRLIGLQPARIILHDDALPIMEDLRRHLHDLEQSTEGLAVGFQGFVGKLPGIAGSLALILHLIKDPAGEWLHAVSQETMEGARRLVLDFILPHAFEFYRTAERATDGEKLQRLASWIVTSKKERIAARDLVRNVRDLRGRSVREIQLAVSPLVAGGWLEPEAAGPENSHWRVLPAVAQQFEARCRQEDARKAALARLMGSPRRAEHG